MKNAFKKIISKPRTIKWLCFLFPIPSIMVSIFLGLIMSYATIDNEPITFIYWLFFMVSFFIFLILPFDVLLWFAYGKRRYTDRLTLLRNPYVTKYNKKEIGVNNVVYLLYCDYSDAYKWIKDSRKPEAYFSNYDKATQILEALDFYRRDYYFTPPTPINQLQELKTNYSKYTTNFIINYWNTTLRSAEKLKTESGKQKKIQSFFDCINTYSSRFTPQISLFIESLKNQDASTFQKKPITLKFGDYTLTSLDDIKNIPLTDFDIAYDLQKAATKFKRNDQMDMAIACLRKSNDISDNADAPLLAEAQYLRLFKFLQYAKLHEEAEYAKKKIYELHPEFLDERIARLPHIKNILRQFTDRGDDLIYIITTNKCPVCCVYNHKVFSISGSSKKYPKLPSQVPEEGGFCPKCSFSMYRFWEGLSTPPEQRT